MKLLFAGSFDPFTVGHKAIVERALPLCDELVIGIGYNEKKRYDWDPDTRVEAIKKLFKSEGKIKVALYQGLTSAFAKKIEADFLLRGVRNIQDFEYERNLADANREVFGLETIFLLSEPSFSFISGSMVRELMHNGYEVKKYIAGDFPVCH